MPVRPSFATCRVRQRAHDFGLRWGQRRLGAASVPRDRGSAVADFAMVSGLVALLFVAVFQVGLTLHIRNTLISCAAEGARLGARADAAPEDGAARARDLITASLSPRFAQRVTASVADADGVDVVAVTVAAPLPVIGPLGPDGRLQVVGRAFRESQ